MTLLRIIALALLSLGSFGAAQAQDYPARQVRMIVPFGAGGPADVYARVIAQHLSEQLKQTFIIENRPGAGSIIGTDAVAKSAPDGYTLLVMSNTHTTNESLVASKPFQLMRDFVPVAPLNYSDLIMVVHPSVPAKDLKEFIALAKKDAGQAQLCVVRRRHAVSHGRRAVQGDERDRHRARAAQGVGRGAQRRDRRACADDVRRDHHDGAERGGRAGAGARHHRDQALGSDARRADRRRSRRSRLRGDDLARRDGAGRHAAADRRQAQCRDREGDQPGGREGGLGEAGRGAAWSCRRPSSTSICAPISRNGRKSCRSPASRRTDQVLGPGRPVSR